MSERGDAPVIEIASAVEDNTLDAGGFRTLRNELADRSGLTHSAVLQNAFDSLGLLLIRCERLECLFHSGDISVATNLAAKGIFASTDGANGPIAIENGGALNISSSLSRAYGIEARASGPNSPIAINNGGNIVATGPSDVSGIFAVVEDNGGGDGVAVKNSGDITVTSTITWRGPLSYSAAMGTAL